MTLVEQYAQSITDRTRARQELVFAVARRMNGGCGKLDDAYHVACRARFADAADYCGEMRVAYVACGGTR